MESIKDGKHSGDKPKKLERRKILRKLGAMEKYQAAHQSLRYYCGTTLTCRYTIPQDLGSLESQQRLENLLELAVAQVVLEQPFMRVGLQGGDSKDPAWVGIDSIDFRNHIQWRIIDASEDYEAVKRDITLVQLDKGFERLETFPAWRLTVLRHRVEDCSSPSLEVILAWSHSNFDGTSGKIFHESLVRSLNELTSGGPDAEKKECADVVDHVLRKDIPVSTDKLPPEQHRLCKFPVSIGYTFHEVWRDVRPNVLIPEDEKATSAQLWAPMRTEPFTTRFLSFIVGRETLASLIRLCRGHQTTLTGLLHGLALVSLTAQLSEEKMVSMWSMTALNMRRFVPAGSVAGYPWLDPERVMMNNVSVMDHLHGTDRVSKIRRLASEQQATDKKITMTGGMGDMVWRTAASVRGEIQKRIDKGTRNERSGLMKLAHDWRAYEKDQAGRPRKAGFCVTNLGAVLGGNGADGPDVGHGFAIDHAEFTLSAEVIDSAIRISPISVGGKRLSVGISWQECVLDGAIGEGLAADLEAWLNELGAAETSSCGPN